jgi:DNA polymerase-3 subunit gamma/tau
VCSACTEIDADRYIDYIELDAASNRSIDEIRDLIERAAYKPGVGRFKVFMIDEAHQLTKDAFNALLKTLEEPPDYLKFVLATTDPEKMLPTVLSRCLQFNLRPMAPETVQAYLAQVLPAENVGFDEGSLRLISRAARGSMRDALSLTDQAIAYGGGKLDEGVVRAMLGSVDRSHASGLVEALARRDGPAVLERVDGLRGLGLSASATLEEMAQLLQQMAVEQAVPGALDVQDAEQGDAVRLAALLPADETQLLYSIVLHGRAELGLMSDEYGALTMVLLRMLAFPPASGAPQQRGPAAPRAAPLRAPSPPAIKLAVLAPAAPEPRMAAPSVATPPPGPAVAAANSALGDRWVALASKLAAQGSIVALARELAWQAGLLSVDDQVVPAVWTLQVEREPLRSPALRDKLAATLAAELGAPVELVLVAGTPDDSPARREAAERAQRQGLAEETIRTDPVVQALLAQYKSARIVPGSIKPA